MDPVNDDDEPPTSTRTRPSRSASSRKRTRTEKTANSFVGTEEYLAPEIITGAGHDFMIDWWSFGILIYELSYGFSPFRGPRRDVTFENVIKKPLHFPKLDAAEDISDDCKDLLRQLLKKRPTERLGHERGAEDIKRHPWFADINWGLIGNSPPPMVPDEPS